MKLLLQAFSLLVLCSFIGHDFPVVESFKIHLKSTSESTEFWSGLSEDDKATGNYQFPDSVLWNVEVHFNSKDSVFGELNIVLGSQDGLRDLYEGKYQFNSDHEQGIELVKSENRYVFKLGELRNVNHYHAMMWFEKEGENSLVKKDSK